MSTRSWKTFLRRILGLVLLFALSPVARGAELPLLVREDFESGSSRWQPTDADAWKIVETPQGKVYSLFRQSKYQPPFRSPLNFALLKDVVVGDFVFEADVQSTVKDYDHRDLVLVFGYQDPAHYYYVHFGKKTDDHANQVFIVNGAARAKISTETTAGTPWDDAWHKVRVVRDTSDGGTEIYFDNARRAVMETIDDTFAWGLVGIGSFDDTGSFDNIVLRGALVPGKSAALPGR